MSDPNLLGDVFKLWELAQQFEPAVSVKLGELPTPEGLDAGLDGLRKGKVVAYLALRMLRRMGFEESAVAGANLLTIGCALYGAGQASRAVHYLDKALALHRRHLGLTDERYLTTLCHWARVHDSLGRGHMVAPAIEECIIRVYETKTAAKELIDLEDHLGRLYQRHGQRDRAQRLLRRVLAARVERLGWNSRWTVETMLALASASETESDLEEAKTLVSRATALTAPHAGIFWADQARRQAHLLASDLALLEGDTESQARRLQQAIEIVEAVTVEQDPTACEPYLKLAENRLAAGDCDAALEVLMALHGRGGGAGNGWMAPADLKRFIALYIAAAHGAGEEIPLAGLLREWIDAAALDFRQAFLLLTETGRSQAAHVLWTEIREYLMFLSQLGDPVPSEDLAHAYELVMEFKGIVAESLCISKERRLTALYPGHCADLERLGELRRLMQSRFADLYPGLPESARERAASQLRLEVREIEERLREEIPEVLDPCAWTVPDAAESLQLVAPGSVLVDFVRMAYSDSATDGKLGVFLLPGGRPDLLTFVTVSDWSTVSSAFDRWRQAICEGDDPLDNELWLSLWGPVEAAISARRQSTGSPIDRLLVSLDDVLHGVPLQVLRNPASGRFLIDEYEISYLGSGRDLRNIPELRELQPGLSLCAGLNDCDAPPDSPYEALHHAEDEVALSGSFLQAEVWTGSAQVTPPHQVRRFVA